MESLGDKLKAAREAKDISFDQASTDTKIAVRYLRALELEDFSGFPGETYVTGFLRNYGDYLDLDVQELLSLYRAFKIQEQPIPVEQLLKQPSPLPKIALGIGLVVLILGLIAGVVLLITRPGNSGVSLPAARAPAKYEMSGDTYRKRFFIDDSLIVPAGESKHVIKLLELGETVTIQTPEGQEVLGLNQVKEVTLDKGGSVLKIEVVEFEKNNPTWGVDLNFELSSAPSLVVVPSETAAGTASITTQSASTVIFSSPNPYPFTLQSNFQNYCMFRWEILQERDRRDRNERYFQRTDELNIQAQNGIRIWVSNAQAAKFQVIGGGKTVSVEIGNAGEVVVADIRWVRDDDNRYRLIVSRLESGNT